MFFFLIFHMICIFFLYSIAVHQRVNTVWLSPDTKNRASVERQAAHWHPWWGLLLSWRRLKPQRVEPPVRVSSDAWHSHMSEIQQWCFCFLKLAFSVWVRVELHWFVWLLPAGGSTQRTMMGFVERRHKDAIQERLELQKVEREAVKPGEARAERGEARGLGGAEIAGARLRAQRSLSPESHRSSSLPPAHRNGPPTTPSTCPPKTTV